MKKRDDLFHLIKAMSKSEKRYFTLDAKKSSSKGSKYLVLFQAVNDMEIYDEAKLKKKFGKNLRYDKSYLYEAIMRSMRDYRSANSYAARIKEMILDAQYLYERGLYEQCGERLEEAKQLAEELDDQLSLLEINMADRELLRQIKGKEYEVIMEKLISEKEGILDALQQEVKYFDLSDKLVLQVNRRFELKNEQEIASFKDKFPLKILANTERDLSKRAELRFFQSSALYFQLLRNYDKVLEYYSQVVNWWNRHQKIREEEFHKYIIDVSNLLHAYASSEKYEEILPLIKQLEREKPRNHHDSSIVFQKASIYKLVYYINSGQSDGVEEVLASVQNGLDKYQIKAGSRNALIFNTSVMLFIHEKFEQCVTWNTRIIKGDKYITRRDIVKGVMLLNLVAIYELGEIEAFEAFTRKVNRFFNKKNPVQPDSFDLKVLSFFRDLYSATRAETKKIYSEMQTYLEEVKNSNSIKVSLGLDELLKWWTDSKIEKKSIIQQIQKTNKIK